MDAYLIKELRDLTRGLETRRTVSIRVGPAGVHYDFAPNVVIRDGFFDYGILSNTSVTVESKQQEGLLQLPAFPPYACEKQLRNCLIERVVTSARIDESRNSAELTLDGDLLLSLAPTSDNRDYWAIYHWPLGYENRHKMTGLVITASEIKRVGRPRGQAGENS